MVRLLRFAALILLSLLAANPALAKDKVPSARDGHRDGFVYDGKQNYPFDLYGVAIDWDKACYAGKAAQCLQLANAYETGLGDLDADLRAAVGYYMLACKAGSGEGCTKAAAMLREGKPGYKNTELASQQADRGCNQLKYQPACASLAVSQANAPGTNASQSDTLLARACTGGDDDGCRMRANTLFYTRADPASRAEALKMYEPACRARKSWGCMGMADAYINGWGVPRDLGRAAEFERIGCVETGGDKLRLCTLHGTNLIATRTKADIERGEGILDASCAANDGLACFTIAQFALGPRTAGMTTFKEALYYARRGCDLGFSRSCTLLGTVYAGDVAQGRDQADTTVAIALFDKACSLGDQAGCNRASRLVAADPGLRRRVPAINPAAPVAEQLKLAKQAVDNGQTLPGVYAVVRLMQEGNEDAEWLLGGWMYYGLAGVFGTERRSDGLILFENAARVGHVDAAIFMGMAYWYGEDVPQDRAKGENYMAIAANRGSKKAQAILRSMQAEPIRQEQARRQKEMEEWQARRKTEWSYSWSTYTPTWSPPATTYNPVSTGPTVAEIYDTHNFNNAMSYHTGGTTYCSPSNPYC